MFMFKNVFIAKAEVIQEDLETWRDMFNPSRDRRRGPPPRGTWGRYSVQLVYSQCTVSVQLVYSQCTVSVQLVYSQCTVSVQLVYSQCTVSVQSVYSQCTVSVQLVHSQSTVSVQLVFSQCTVSEQLVYSQCTVKLWIHRYLLLLDTRRGRSLTPSRHRPSGDSRYDEAFVWSMGGSSVIN